MFSRQTIAAIAQVLTSLENSFRFALLYKHLGASREELPTKIHGLIETLVFTEDAAVLDLVKELATNSSSIRTEALTRYVFDERFEDLEKWLLYDGWRIDERRLIRVGPAVTDAAEVQDDLLDLIASLKLDQDGEVRRLISDAANDFVASPPDFNGSNTKVRIALETLVKRIAIELGGSGALGTGRNKWGVALSILRTHSLIDVQTEQTIAGVYTLISPAAHIPVGIDDEEWARLTRTFAVSICYYVIKIFEAV